MFDTSHMKNQYPTFSMDAVRGADLTQRHNGPTHFERDRACNSLSLIVHNVLPHKRGQSKKEENKKKIMQNLLKEIKLQ